VARAGAIQSHPWVVGGPILVLALRHLGRFAFERRRREHLHCGLFVGGFGLLFYANFATSFSPFSARASRTFPLATAGSILA